MTIDKEIKPIIDAMITTELSGATKRFFAFYVLGLMSELYDNGTKELDTEYLGLSGFNHKDTEQRKLITFASKVLPSYQVKKLFCKTLDMLKKKKDDIVADLLNRYSLLHNNKDVTYYHDKVSMYFDREINLAKDLISAGRYKKFYDTVDIAS